MAKEGGKGLIGFSGNVFFIVERVGGYSFYKLIGGGGGSIETHPLATDHTAKTRQRVHLDFILFFLLLRGRGVEEVWSFIFLYRRKPT
jgi:hypothetical protein